MKVFIWIQILSIGVLLNLVDSTPCFLRDLGHNKKVCVCNSTYCDTVESVSNIPEGRFVAFTSSEKGLRFSKIKAPFTKTAHNNSIEGASSFVVDTNKTYQEILGFGGAFTDATAININSLSKGAKQRLIRSYFSKKGIEYSLGRVPIGGTDFSTRFYTYDDGDVDTNLTNFALQPEDIDLKIPLIKEARRMSERNIRLFASSWSPPVWMKTRKAESGLSLLKKEYFETYTQYLLRFLDEYRAKGLEFWAISTGNEPSLGLSAFTHINSLGWLPWSASNWIANSFGPGLKNSSHNQTLLLAFEDQRVFLPWWLELMTLVRKDVLQYIDGISVHWYWDWLVGPGVIEDVHKKYSDKFILYTEASMGSQFFQKKVDLGSWSRGERYIMSILENINSGVSGWTDWNMALDTEGGPTYISNNLDSPIIVNATSDEFYKQPLYYALGHVSKFVAPGALRVQINPTDTWGLHTMAALNPDNKTVIVIVNKKNSHADVAIKVVDKGWVNLVLPEKSFTTIIC